MGTRKYDDNVFLNCPFDSAYKPLFNALIFAVYDCGFVARCALEEDDGSRIRVEKIYQIISDCRLGVHDLSRVKLDRDTRLPRFNMPMELGAFLGAKHFGDSAQKRKSCLILDSEQYRYQKFISDIAGQDIRAHENDAQAIVNILRNWLRGYSSAAIPSGGVIWDRYETFKHDLPLLCRELRLRRKELIWNDYVQLIARWLTRNA
jgi:hypothetical protein